MKKSFSVLIALLLACQLFAVSAFAETVYTEGTLYYTIADESITIVGYFGSSHTVYVPASVAGIPVNTIASGAFTGTPVKTLYLPDTITSVQSGAVDAGVTVVYNSNVQNGSVTQRPTNPTPTPSTDTGSNQPQTPVPTTPPIDVGTGTVQPTPNPGNNITVSEFGFEEVEISEDELLEILPDKNQEPAPTDAPEKAAESKAVELADENEEPAPTDAPEEAAESEAVELAETTKAAQDNTPTLYVLIGASVLFVICIAAALVLKKKK